MSESAIDDNQTIERILTGDRDAFAVLVRKYETRVRGYCRNTLRDAMLAEDAAQEIFLKAYQGLPRFRRDAAFSSWLYRITVNHCRDLLRKMARHRTESWDGMLDEERARIEALLAAPDDAPQRLEDAELMQRLLARLAPAYREILLLRESQGLSYEELMAVLGCSLDAVKGRLKRARKELLNEARHLLLRPAVETDRGA